MKQLFEVTAEVDATGKAPPWYSQATVFAVVAADSEAAASGRMARDLEGSGHTLVPPGIKVAGMDPGRWPQYVAERWAGMAHRLPDQKELERMLQEDFLLHLSFFPHE